jgi:KipI family sensor histidine kinase inhibitor
MSERTGIQPVGDSALLVSLGERIDPAINQRVHALARRLSEAKIAGLEECVPGYATLLVHYDPSACSYPDLLSQVRRFIDQPDEIHDWQPREIEIPVVYGGENGPDLAFIAEHCGLSEAEVIRLHSSADYTVYMMGFMPGFPYLGGLDRRIAAPRLATPRSRVPAGSVGIAGEQTGVYPLESPGGWRLIGRTRFNLFDPGSENPFLLAPGDKVRFVSIQV